VECMKPLVAQYGTTVVEDGASAVDKTPFMNLLRTSVGVLEFIKTTDCTGEVKNARYCADVIINYIQGLKDPFSVVQVLTDNAIRSAWPLIEAACSWVQCGPCAPHCLDLEVEDFYKAFPWMCEVVQKAIKLRNFINWHQAILAVFRTLGASMLGTPGTTRFGTVSFGCASVMKNRDELERTIYEPEVRRYVERNKNFKNNAGIPLIERFREVKGIVEDIEGFWEPLQGVLDVMSPPLKVLRTADGDGPTASKLHYMMFQAQEELENLSLPFLSEDQAQEDRQKAVEIHCARWDYMFTDIMATGYVLDPEYWDIENKAED